MLTSWMFPLRRFKIDNMYFQCERRIGRRVCLTSRQPFHTKERALPLDHWSLIVPIHTKVRQASRIREFTYYLKHTSALRLLPTDTLLTQHILTCTDAHCHSAHHTWCYTLTCGSSSSCAFHKIVISSLLCNFNVSRHARNTQHIFFIFFLRSSPTKVAHIQKSVRWSTRTRRWRIHWSRTSHRLWAQQDRRQPDHWWTGGYYLHWTQSDYWNWGSWQIFVLHPVTVVFHSRFYWKYCYVSRSRLGGRTNSCTAGFTTVHTRGRSKCGTITHLSLWKRRLDVQFIPRSELHRHKGTCCIVFTSELAESRRVFRER